MKIRNRLLSGLAATALAAAGLLGTASSASASATGCTWAPGGPGANQCMHIEGGGLHIDWVKESYTTGSNPDNVCRYDGAWQGNFQASGWTIYYGSYVAGCSWQVAWEGPYSVGNGWMWDSDFYGYWLSDNTGGQWTSPVVEHIFA